MRTFNVILSILLLGACAREEGYSTASFKDERTAEIQMIGQPMEVGVPVDLCYQGNYLFVLAHTPQFWLHIYDKESGRLVSESIMTGRGPGEGVSLVSMDYRKYEQNLYVYDMAQRKTLVYKLDGENGAAMFVREIEHPKEGVIRKCWVLPDGNYLYEGYLEGDLNTRLTLSDGKSSLDSFSEFPGIDNDNDRFAFMLGVSKNDPARGRYVCATMFGAVLECFDLKDNTVRSRAVRLIDPPEMDMSGTGIQPKPGKKYGFATLCLDGDTILANYMDTTDPYDFKRISTFDWNGREKIRYTADRNILRLCPGEKTGKELFCIVSSLESEFSLARLILK